MTERKIMWESQHYEFMNNGRIKKVDEEWSPDDDIQLKLLDDLKKGKVVNTPWGMFDVDDSMNPLRQFKLWMAHTNFTVSSKVKNTIMKIPGVEIFRPISKYRFIIAIGKVFKFSDVRIAIENALCGKHSIENIISRIDNEDIQKKIADLKKELAGKNKNWAIYVLPNGKVEHISSNIKDEEYDKKLNRLQRASEISHGILIKSYDEQKKKDNV